MRAVYRPEHHSFKSINGVTSTDKVACIPTSLGQHGSILRPAIFESPETRDAPFLLSLPFLLHCQASLHLDPQEGFWMDLKRFNHRVPLLIGPTGALRVPLQAFSPRGTHFQLVIPMSAESASDIRKAYRQWIRFFGVPRKLLIDLGTEFCAEFRRQAEQDGSEVALSSVEAPTQRGLTERAGGVFKNILYKSMMDYSCQSREEWLELVDVACMVRNRLLLRAGYSPIQRVIGYSPRLPGGLLSGGDHDHMAADLIRIGDQGAVRAMKMRKAAAIAFHEADCDQALRAAALGGPRRFQNFEVGQAVYFWRRGAGTHKKTRDSYWQWSRSRVDD